MKAMVKKTGGFPYYKTWGVIREDGVMLHEFTSDNVCISSWEEYQTFEKKQAKKMCDKINKGELSLGKRQDFCFGHVGFWGKFHAK